MATQSIVIYQNEDGTTATLVYDDVALTASSITLNVLVHSITVTATVNGSTVTRTYAAGLNQTFPLNNTPVVIGTSRGGFTTVTIAAVSSFSVAINGV